MLRVVYNEYKGYCIAKNGCFDESENNDEVTTDGFDQFDWSEHQDEKTPKSYYDSYTVEADDAENESMYADESDVALNHQRDGGFSMRNVESEEVKNKLPPKSKALSKHQRKLERKREKKAQKGIKGSKKDKNTHYSFDNVASDAKSVKVLNNLYAEIISVSGKKRLDDKILQFFDVSIYGEDLVNLKDDEWFNDNDISFVYEYLERYQLSKYDKLVSSAIQLVRPSMVYLLAQTPEPQQLRGVIPPLEKGKFLFLPVNDNDDVEAVCAGSHWSLVVISMLDKVAMVYDSMEQANEREARDVITKVEDYLNDGTKFHVRLMSTPQQLNGSDCGVIVSQITAYLTSKLLQLDYLQEHYVDMSLDKVHLSSIDGRIFIMGTLLNVLKHKLNKA